MALLVEVEILTDDCFIGVDRWEKGQVIAVAPHVASRMITRGIAEKVGVTEAEGSAPEAETPEADEAEEGEGESNELEESSD